MKQNQPVHSKADDHPTTPAETKQLRPRSWWIAVLLSFFLGPLGADRYYLGYYGIGTLKLITFGFFGLWWLIDLFLILIGKLPDINGVYPSIWRGPASAR